MTDDEFNDLIEKQTVQILDTEFEKVVMQDLFNLNKISLSTINSENLYPLLLALSLLNLKNFQATFKQIDDKTLSLCFLLMMEAKQQKNSPLLINRVLLFKQNSQLNNLVSPMRARLISELLADQTMTTEVPDFTLMIKEFKILCLNDNPSFPFFPLTKIFEEKKLLENSLNDKEKEKSKTTKI